MAERIDRRILGGVEWVDAATATPIQRGLAVTSELAQLFCNRSGLHVVAAAEGLKAHREAFEEPPLPPPDLGEVAVRLEVSDPSGWYLPRTARVAFPRNPDPAAADSPDSVFQPVVLALYPTASRPLSGNASAVRVSVVGEGGTEPVGGALLRVVEQGTDRRLARGLSDLRGEALVVVPGVPLTRFADGEDGDGAAEGPVVTAETHVRLEVVTEPGLPWPVDPDRLEENRAAWLRNGEDPMLLTLRTGRTVTIQVQIQLPG